MAVPVARMGPLPAWLEGVVEFLEELDNNLQADTSRQDDHMDAAEQLHGVVWHSELARRHTNDPKPERLQRMEGHVQRLLASQQARQKKLDRVQQDLDKALLRNRALVARQARLHALQGTSNRLAADLRAREKQLRDLTDQLSRAEAAAERQIKRLAADHAEEKDKLISQISRLQSLASAEEGGDSHSQKRWRLEHIRNVDLQKDNDALRRRLASVESRAAAAESRQRSSQYSGRRSRNTIATATNGRTGAHVQETRVGAAGPSQCGNIT